MALKLRLVTRGSIRLEGCDGLRPKELLVLAYVALKGARGASRNELAGLFWPHREESLARGSLRQVLRQFRRRLGDSVQISADRVVVDPERLGLDLDEPADSSGEAFLAGAELEAGEELRAWIEGERARIIRRQGRSQPAETASEPSAVSGLLAPVLIGRAGELEQLRYAWREALQGDAITVIVEGGEGCGKTRLLESFLESVLREGQPAVVLRATGPGEGATRPWSLARELLAPIIHSASQRLSGPVSTALAFDRAPSGQVQQALTALLTEVQGNAPMLLAVDDAAQADYQSQRWLAQLAGNVPGPRLLILSGSAVELSASPMLAPLRRESVTRSLRLLPLGPSNVRQLIESMVELPRSELDLLVSGLTRQGEVTPLYVSETLRLLAEENALRPGLDQHWQLRLGEAVLPAGAEEAIRRRLSRLDQAAWLALEAVVIRVRSGDPRQGPIDAGAVDRLVGLSLLTHAESGGRGGYRFSHPLIERVVGERVGGRPPIAGPTRPRFWPRLAAVVALVVGLGLATVPAFRFRTSRPSLIAVAPIQRYGPRDSLNTVDALGELLLTSISRIPGLTTLSRVRLSQLAGEELTGSDRTRIVRAAQHGGASDLLDARLYGEGNQLRLALTLENLGRGATRHAFQVTGADIFELADQAADTLARRLGLPPPPTALTEITTRSVLAYRLYEEGLRAYYRTDRAAAAQLFLASLQEDSSFALAAYFAARSLPSDSARLRLRRRALALAPRAGERDRLTILADLRYVQNDLSALSFAESLATRYPLEPEAHRLYGRVLRHAGSFDKAIVHLERALALDSLAQSGARGCVRCEIAAELGEAYRLAGSIDRAIALARLELRRDSTNPAAWETLALWLAYARRPDESWRAYQRAVALNPGAYPSPTLEYASLRFEAGDFATAEPILASLSRTGSVDQRLEALWNLMLLHRWAGRLEEAQADIAATNELDRQLGRAGRMDLQRATVLREQSRLSEALSLLKQVVSRSSAVEEGVDLRIRSWVMAQLAVTLDAAGDTLSLQAVADSLEQLGQRSLYGRDRQLHHFARGLLARRRGDLRLAEREFRQAAWSLSGGFSRINYELARTLVDLGRPVEAIPILRQAFLAGPQSNGTYLTRSELHLLLARTYRRVGQVDSARASYRWVEAAWSHADPGFSARRDSVLGELAQLE